MTDARREDRDVVRGMKTLMKRTTQAGIPQSALQQGQTLQMMMTRSRIENTEIRSLEDRELCTTKCCMRDALGRAKKTLTL